MKTLLFLRENSKKIIKALPVTGKAFIVNSMIMIILQPPHSSFSFHVVTIQTCR